MEIIIAVVGLIASGVVFYVKQLYKKISDIDTKLQKHLVEDAEKYVPRSELQEFANRIRLDVQAMVSPINDKLQSIEEYLRERKS